MVTGNDRDHIVWRRWRHKMIDFLFLWRRNCHCREKDQNLLFRIEPDCFLIPTPYKSLWGFRTGLYRVRLPGVSGLINWMCLETVLNCFRLSWFFITYLPPLLPRPRLLLLLLLLTQLRSLFGSCSFAAGRCCCRCLASLHWNWKSSSQSWYRYLFIAKVP